MNHPGDTDMDTLRINLEDIVDEVAELATKLGELKDRLQELLAFTYPQEAES